MNERMDGLANEGTDPTCELLSGGAWPSAPEAAVFRTALLAQTTSLVRRRARWRRVRRMATICLAYSAGLLTMFAIARLPSATREKPLAMRPGSGESRLSPSAKPRSSDHAAREQPRPKPADELASLSPAELRRLVPRAPREKQVRLLALAGDRYLFNQADVESALDCYRQVIELTPAGERAPPRPEDIWLLAELKAAAQ